jgi:hypothetical protein
MINSIYENSCIFGFLESLIGDEDQECMNNF